jgi:hypothetical protein
MTPSPWLEIQIKGRIKVKPTLDKIRQHMLEGAKIFTERSVANDSFYAVCWQSLADSTSTLRQERAVNLLVLASRCTLARLRA